MKPTSSKGVLPRRPLSIAALLVLIAACGNALLVGCGGGASQNTENTQTTETTTPPAETPPATTASADPLVDGAQIYKERCVLCHGAEGKGDGVGAAGLNPKPRNHTDGAYMKTRTDADLIGVITNGKGQMPAWGKILTEQQIQHVLMYVRTLAK
jgi:mono/diheme cytochrome c family protein